MIVGLSLGMGCRRGSKCWSWHGGWNICAATPFLPLVAYFAPRKFPHLSVFSPLLFGLPLSLWSSFFCRPLPPFLQLPKSRLPLCFPLSLLSSYFFSCSLSFLCSLNPQASTYSLLPPWQVTSLPHVHAALYLKKPAPHSWK